MSKEVMEMIVIVNGDCFSVLDLFKDKYMAEMVTSDYPRSGKRVVELTIPEEVE